MRRRVAIALALALGVLLSLSQRGVGRGTQARAARPARAAGIQRFVDRRVLNRELTPQRSGRAADPALAAP